MNRNHGAAIAMMVIGLALIVIGTRTPQRTLSMIAGGLFILAGILRMVRGSRTPPAPPA